MPPRIAHQPAHYQHIPLPPRRAPAELPNVGPDIAKAIGGMFQANRQAKAQAARDAVANQLLQQHGWAPPPRAGLVAPGVNPATGQPNVIPSWLPTAGTAPASGGVEELNMRINEAKARAGIASELALAGQRTGGGGGRGGGGGGAAGGNASRWQQYLGGGGQGAGAAAGKAGKAAPYKPYSIDAETDSRADEFSNIQADFDAKYGKGMYGKVTPNLANAKAVTAEDVKAGTATQADTGKIIVNDAKGNTILTLPPDQAQYWQNRFNAGSVAAGQKPVGPLTGGVNPNSGTNAGTQTNPIKVESNLQLRALPYGTWIQGPDGSVQQKKALTPPEGQKTSQADTGDQGQQDFGERERAVADVTGAQQPIQPQQAQADSQDTSLADAIAQTRAADQLRGAAIPAQPPPQLAALTPPSTPGSFDLGGLPPSGGLPQDTDLADAIKRARTQDQLSA